MSIINEPGDFPVGTVGDLLDLWRMKADQAREMGFEPVARAYEECRDTLKAAHFKLREEKIPVSTAAEETGYTESHLYGLIRDGKLHHVKEGGRIFVRRRDLPRRPVPPEEALTDGGFSEAALYDEPL